MADESLMTSVADMHPDADDDLSEITPELVLVDPELARRLRERELAAMVEEPPATPVLRLVPHAPEPEAPAPPVPEAEPAEPSAPDPEADDPVALAEPEREPEPEQPDAPPAPVAPSEPPEELIVPRPATAETFVIREADPAPAEPLPVETRQVFPPRAPAPPRRRGRVLRFVLAVAIVAAAVVAILALIGESPLSESSAPPSFPVADGGAQPAATPPPPAATPPAPQAPKTKAPSATKPKATQPKATQPKATKPQATKPKSTTPKKTATRAKKPSPPAAQPRRFAWAPVAGATSYHVELFRGDDRVYAGDTRQPVLELGPTWRYEGRATRLTDGSYRWYVWSVGPSGRSAQAVVQATLTVP